MGETYKCDICGKPTSNRTFFGAGQLAAKMAIRGATSAGRGWWTMRSCMKCRHAKRRVILGWAIDHDYCAVRNGWPISHPVLRALTCPAYENDYKLVEGWRELHDKEVDDGR